MPPLQPDMPGGGEKEKIRIPSQRKVRETGDALPGKNRKQTENRRGIKQAVQAFRHAGERDENPKTHKPAAPPLPPFVATNRAVNRAGDKGAEDRLRHNDAAKEKSTTTTEMDQSGEKTAPRAAEAITDDKSEGNGGQNAQRNGEAGRRGR